MVLKGLERAPCHFSCQLLKIQTDTAILMRYNSNPIQRCHAFDSKLDGLSHNLAWINSEFIFGHLR